MTVEELQTELRELIVSGLGQAIVTAYEGEGGKSILVRHDGEMIRCYDANEEGLT